MSAAVAKLAKPQLRGALNSAIKLNISIALGLTAVSGVVTYFYLCEARKKKYADFYRDYDAKADFNRMKTAGVFSSVK